MPDLTGPEDAAAENLTVTDDTRTDTLAHCDGDKILREVLAVLFPIGIAVGVIENNDRHIQPLFQLLDKECRRRKAQY